MKQYVTKTGRVLTDADFERLADEAERGYKVPKKRTVEKREPMMVIAIRMPKSMVEDIAKRAQVAETSVSEIIRDLIQST